MLYNFVSETISVGGTGNLTLSGKVDAAHLTFATLIPVNQYFHYVAKDGNNREEGIGHLSASTTLVRDTIIATISGGVYDNTSPAALSLSTATVVSIVSSASNVFPGPSHYWDTQDSGVNGVSCNFFATGLGSSLTSLSANQMHATPCFLPRSMLVTSVELYCVVAASGSSLNVGAYTRAADGQVGNLFAEFTAGASIDTSTSGAKSATLGTPVVFPAGDFWMVSLSNGTPQIRSVPDGNAYNHGYGLSTGGTIYTTLRKTQTFGALPSTMTAPFTGSYQICYWVK